MSQPNAPQPSDYDKARAACMAVARIVMNLPPKDGDADALLHAYELLSQCEMEACREPR